MEIASAGKKLCAGAGNVGVQNGVTPLKTITTRYPDISGSGSTEKNMRFGSTLGTVDIKPDW